MHQAPFPYLIFYSLLLGPLKITSLDSEALNSRYVWCMDFPEIKNPRIKKVLRKRNIN